MEKKAVKDFRGWWVQGVAAWVSLGVGWAGLFALSLDAFAFSVQVANAPQSDFALTAAAIRSARKSLHLNLYEFTAPELAEVLEERIRAGVHVEILQEGQPVGGVQRIGRDIQDQLISAMSEAGAGDQFFEMRSASKGAHRRFRFDHAKYVIVDGEALLISSENYSPTGHPVPGNRGNRGWEVLIHERNLARAFLDVFRYDSDPSYGDVGILHQDSSWTRGRCGSSGLVFICPTAGTPWMPTFFQDASAAAVAGKRWKRNPMEDDGILTVEASLGEGILAPDSSLSGLLNMIEEARTSLDLEQMDFKMDWKQAGGRSPLFDAVVQAARRGVRVRVLLNDETAFARNNGSPLFFVEDLENALLPAKAPRVNQNLRTVHALNDLAQQEGLPLEARIADVDAMGVRIIHNKGALVDGSRTLISSINWSENSVTNNREAAVLLTSPEAYDYFGGLFEQDWRASGGRFRWAR